MLATADRLGLMDSQLLTLMRICMFIHISISHIMNITFHI
jgi:hypothetical protein